MGQFKAWTARLASGLAAAAVLMGLSIGVPAARAQDESPVDGEAPQGAMIYRVYLPVAINNDDVGGPIGAQEEVAQVLALTNAERAKVGCGALTIHNTLAIVAQAHAQDMAENDFFDHNSLNGASPFDRMHNAGYNYSSAAENIAAGYATPASVVAGWMGSSGHRANILNCNYTQIGVGYYKLDNDTGSINYVHYWVQDFGRP